MHYSRSDSSGTDDDAPPSHPNRIARGSGPVSLNGRSSGGQGSYMRMQMDMELQIHELEKDAYRSVIKAFNAQSDAITWAKEGLMSELRKELRVSDEEHRELLAKVNKDDQLKRIREWRQGGVSQGGLMTVSAPSHDPIPSPSVSASRKKQKISHLPPLSIPSQPGLSHLPAPSQPSSSAGKRGSSIAAKNKKSKMGPMVSSPIKAAQQAQATGIVAGRGAISNRGQLGSLGLGEPREAATVDPLVGRRVRTRWPEDNTFYEAVITDYDKEKGLHALVYDMNTNQETWEWVNLKEISPEDIMWDLDGPPLSVRGNRGVGGRGSKKGGGRGGLVSSGRGRGTLKGQTRKDLVPSQNGTGKKLPSHIEILDTEAVLRAVERIAADPHPDPSDIEKGKKMLKDQEQTLMNFISLLGETSDGESGDVRRPVPSRTESMDGERGWRNRPYAGKMNAAVSDYDMVGDRPEGSDGDREHILGEGGVPFDEAHDRDDDM